MEDCLLSDVEAYNQRLKLQLWTVLSLTLGCCCAADVTWQFDGGSLDRVEKISPEHLRLFVKGQTDQDGRNRQASWYYFRVDDTSRKELTLDIVGLPGEYNYKPNRGAITKDTPPVISYDAKHWQHVRDFDYDPVEPRLRLRIHPERQRFWMAHTPPYSTSDLENLRSIVRHHSDAREQVIGKSVEGRDLLLWTIGSATPNYCVWLMFRQHAWESGSSWTGEGAVRALLADPKLRSRVTWKILPMADPDGVSHGGVRFNRNGYDLNRNWDVSEPRLMPEIVVQRTAIKQWLSAGNSIDLFLTLHNTETAEYLEGMPGGLANDLFKALNQHTTFAPSRPFAPVVPTQQKGRADVVQALNKLGVPAFLMEQRISLNPKLGHLPEIPDRMRFGRELARTIADVLSGASR